MIMVVLNYMEITTYIENHTSIDLPPFKHPTRTISTQDPANRQLYYSQNITFPDKIIIPTYQTPLGSEESIKCYILFGYKLQLKDWEMVKKLYPGIRIRIKLFRGNLVTQVSDSVIQAKSYLKGQKTINEPERTLVKTDEKILSSYAHMYTVQLIPDDPTECTKVIYYLPSAFDKNSPDYGLNCIKYRYFNHKMLQILNEYVSLDNNNTSCYKDMAHHQFETTVYSGKVISFEVFIKLLTNQCNVQVCESFVEKLSQISMTDKHLLDEVDPLDFSEIKKQIRNAYLEQKRIRKSLTLDKLKIVEEIENALQFLNLKQTFCQKLTYSAITSEMLKKIRNQNIENKAAWIKQQNLIIKNLDARLLDLELTKQRHKQILLEQEKTNSQQIQAIRNQIRELQTNIRCEQAQKANQVFHDSIHLKNTSLKSQNHNKNGQMGRSSIHIKKTQNETMRQKQQLEELEKEKILKFEMIKAEFEMEKQFSRRKTEYAKAAQDLLNYLVDC